MTLDQFPNFGQNMMNTTIDFDEYAEKAQSDPRCFAAERERLLTEQIADSFDPDKIAAYQLQIDGMRLEQSPGISACKRLEAEMFDRLEILLRVCEQLEKQLDVIPRKP